MTAPQPREPQIDHLVDHMFHNVLTDDERGELIARIRAWEAANPGLPASARISAWIDIAYEYQAGR